MIRRILLDASTIIACFDTEGRTAVDIRTAATDRLEALATDPSVRFALTPLIRYEVLRGVPRPDFGRLGRLRRVLDGFETLDVTDEIAELASELFRMDSHERGARDDRTIDKRRFDTFHFATAVTYDIELISEDAGMASLRQLHERLIAADAT